MTNPLTTCSSSIRRYIFSSAFTCGKHTTNHTIVRTERMRISKIRKISKIRPGAYIFQGPFSRGLFLEGLIFGGVYLRREICVSKSIGLAL